MQQTTGGGAGNVARSLSETRRHARRAIITTTAIVVQPWRGTIAIGGVGVERVELSTRVMYGNGERLKRKRDKEQGEKDKEGRQRGKAVQSERGLGDGGRGERSKLVRGGEVGEEEEGDGMVDRKRACGESDCAWVARVLRD